MALTTKQMEEMLLQLKAENEQLKAKLVEKDTGMARALSLRQAGDKGTVGVYGLNRQFPVSLYASQWFKLAAFLPKVLAFLADPANKGKLAFKPNTDPDQVISDGLDDVRIAFAAWLDSQHSK